MSGIYVNQQCFLKVAAIPIFFRKMEDFCYKSDISRITCSEK